MTELKGRGQTQLTALIIKAPVEVPHLPCGVQRRDKVPETKPFHTARWKTFRGKKSQIA